jgi:inorganic triphosphatase YgiF
MEIEFKLTVLDPAVLADLSARSELAGYLLQPGPDHELRDRYWDTPADDLAHLGQTLRLRLSDGQPRFTLKRDQGASAGLFRRDELELPASAASWGQVLTELERSGLRLEPGAPTADRPASWLRAAGLVQRQDRATSRQTRYAERAGASLAEIALDTTRYRVGPYEIVYREIEVEALTDSEEHARALGLALQQLFGERVTLSGQGKYSRGLALAARLA